MKSFLICSAILGLFAVVLCQGPGGGGPGKGGKHRGPGHGAGRKIDGKLCNGTALTSDETAKVDEVIKRNACIDSGMQAVSFFYHCESQ